MPKSDVIQKLERLINTGFQTIGARVSVERDEESLSVRNLLIESSGGRIYVYDSEDSGAKPVFSVPSQGLTSCASWVVISILTGKAVRAIEDCFDSMNTADTEVTQERT